MPPQPIPEYDPRRGLRVIAEIIQKTPRADRRDRIVHLQRIMLDAGAGVSRYKLWLTARAAEQAKWRRVLRDNLIVDAQESALNASPETLSASIVHQALDTGTKKL
ncbi:hypothetical protein EV401DRAFT_2073110 [Pisolithus croceorrhizus]|nr:hypothetical protein EV401DRAFT_2073110 [Pisolithus croceorrhizus]